jgi:hypothetical protein
MMVGRLHPTVRGELLIGAAVFLLGAAIGVLWEAADAMLTARRAEREQLRGAGALLDELEDERDELQRQLDAGDVGANLEVLAERDELRRQREHDEAGWTRRYDEIQRERDELAREVDELQARMIAAAVAPLPLDAVRAAIEQADDGELLRDAVERARGRCACETGQGVCYCAARDEDEPEREQDGAGGPGDDEGAAP